jgi:NAD(P)-dependent dehydrogenase (short-subunit alcohol dehydrogenase family)
MLNGKTIIVTGGSGQLGKEMIADLKKHRANAVNFDINIESNLIQGLLCVDITKDSEIISAVKKVKETYGKIDGLVNNAYPRTEDWGTAFEEISPDSWRKNVDWQLNSYFVVSQEVLKYMRTQKSGSIINIASIYGVVGNDFTIYENTNMGTAAAYSAIKGGLINFSRYLAALYGPHGIRVNAISPGGIFNHQPEPFVKAYEKKVPLKRLGNPDDIAPVVSFILSDGAKYITGQNIIVDGGWTAI